MHGGLQAFVVNHDWLRLGEDGKRYGHILGIVECILARERCLNLSQSGINRA
jgi:hypothetical protein